MRIDAVNENFELKRKVTSEKLQFYESIPKIHPNLLKRGEICHFDTKKEQTKKKLKNNMFSA